MEERRLKTKEPFPSRYGKYSIALIPKFFTSSQKLPMISITYIKETIFIEWALSLLFVE